MLTVGLPFFNNEKTLLSAINSVLIQTYTDWELLLIDDGSTDNSCNIAREIAALDKRITLLSDGHNRGLIYRLNEIIDLARGDYIARMDADDMMMPNRIEFQMDALLKDLSIDVIDCAVFTIDENNKPIGIRGNTPLVIESKRMVLKKSLLIHPAIIAKKAWCQNNRYRDGFHRAEDYELWCRTFEKSKFSRIKAPLYLYREGSVNIKNYAASMKTIRKVLQLYGPEVFTQKELVIEILKTYLKGYFYKLFGFFGLHYLLTAKRNAALSEMQVEQIERIILKIINYRSS